VALIATLVGVWLVRIVNAQTFYVIVYIFMGLIGAKLTYDGAVGLFL
jgi:uncharacterized membrane protein YfcA